MLRRPGWLLVGSMLIVLLAGCGTEPERTTGGGTPGSATPTASETAPDRAAGPSSSAPAQSAGVTVTLEYTGGQVSGDTGRVEVPLGEPVTLVVTSDVADEVHSARL